MSAVSLSIKRSLPPKVYDFCKQACKTPNINEDYANLVINTIGFPPKWLNRFYDWASSFLKIMRAMLSIWLWGLLIIIILLLLQIIILLSMPEKYVPLSSKILQIALGLIFLFGASAMSSFFLSVSSQVRRRRF